MIYDIKKKEEKLKPFIMKKKPKINTFSLVHIIIFN